MAEPDEALFATLRGRCATATRLGLVMPSRADSTRGLESRRPAPMAQLAEAGGLNPPKYGFKSHWGHTEKCHLTRYYSDLAFSGN